MTSVFVLLALGGGLVVEAWMLLQAAGAASMNPGRTGPFHFKSWSTATGNQQSGTQLLATRTYLFLSAIILFYNRLSIRISDKFFHKAPSLFKERRTPTTRSCLVVTQLRASIALIQSL